MFFKNLFDFRLNSESRMGRTGTDPNVYSFVVTILRLVFSVIKFVAEHSPLKILISKSFNIFEKMETA